MIDRALPAFLLSLVIGFGIWGGLCWYEKKKGIMIKKKEATAILAGYILFLLCITVFFRTKGNGYLLDLVPFNTPGGNHLIFLYALSNSVVFIPIGILLTNVLPGERRSVIIFLAIILSGGIEVLQFVLQCGDCQTEDVLMNVLGVFVGFEGERFIKKEWEKRKHV